MAIQVREETQDHLVFKGRREWLEVKALMVQRVIQVLLGLLGIKDLQVFRVCLEKEALLALLVLKVTGAV